MFYIGCHLSAADGFLAMGRTALSIGANTFQFFTRNPRGSKAKAIDPADVAAFLALAAENEFGTLVAHAPYTINPCSKDEHTREFARMTLADDLKRMEHLPGNVYNFHPGSHTGQGMETGIAQIAETLNAILTPDIRTTVLLETMSGKGSEVGSRFEELREIISSWTRNHTIDEIDKMLNDAGCPACPVNTIDRLVKDPQIAGDRGMFPEIDQPGMGKLQITAMAQKLTRTKSCPRKGAPLLGEDNAAIYGEMLDFDEAKLTELKEKGVI